MGGEFSKHLLWQLLVHRIRSRSRPGTGCGLKNGEEKVHCNSTIPDGL